MNMENQEPGSLKLTIGLVTSFSPSAQRDNSTSMTPVLFGFPFPQEVEHRAMHKQRIGLSVNRPGLPKDLPQVRWRFLLRVILIDRRAAGVKHFPNLAAKAHVCSVVVVLVSVGKH